MATLMTTLGLQRVAVQASQATAGSGPTYGAGRAIQTMSVDDSSVAFTAADTNLAAGGPVTNEFDKAFDATPTRSGQTVSHVMTLATGDYNQTIRRIALHDDTPANVTTSSTTLVAGIDGLSLVKNTSFTLKTTFNITYS
jgi:hypothetical protein